MKALDNLRQDLPAGIVVFFVAVPLCLGIALASGAPLFSGLIAGIVGGLIVGSLSGSPLGVSGPAAGLAVIVLNAIGELGYEPFLLAVVLAGFFQIVLGIARAGVLGYFFPSSVIRGMLAGIGIIIVQRQIPHAFGYKEDPTGELSVVQASGETTFSEFTHLMGAIEWNAVIVAAVSLAILILWDTVLTKRGKVFELIQGPLVAVGFGIAFQLITKSFGSDHLVSVPVSDSFDGFLALFTQPHWGSISNPAIWVTGFTIAVVASLETLLCLEATDKLDPQKRVTPTNRELLAQGAGNIVSGTIGGLPITQVIVRSSANIQSGGRTKASAIVHGLFLLLSVVFLPDVLNLVPLSVLAAILFVVGYKLAKPALFMKMYKLGWEQFLPFVVTIAGIVFTDLLSGIAMGMAVAILIILRRNYLNSFFMHVEEGGGGGPQSVCLRLSEEVTFLNKAAILREFSRIPDGSRVTLDLTGTISVDHDVQEIIDEFEATAHEREIEVEVLERPASANGLPQRRRSLSESIPKIRDIYPPRRNTSVADSRDWAPAPLRGRSASSKQPERKS